MSVSSATANPSLASSLANINGSTTTGSATPQKTLTAQDFMQLLTVQMQNQDPSTPMDSNQEMQQIVQISSMQNMSTMSTDLTQMSASQTWTLANSYLGRQVTISNSSGSPITGSVTSIDTSGATPQVQVNGTYYPLANVTSIQLPSSSSVPSTTTPSPTSG
jgi:flagellar basal-body rod modification protein FlgD